MALADWKSGSLVSKVQRGSMMSCIVCKGGTKSVGFLKLSGYFRLGVFLEFGNFGILEHGCFFFKDSGDIRYMGVSLNGGIYPQIIHFNRDFHYKSSILGYHHFRKHP